MGKRWWFLLFALILLTKGAIYWYWTHSPRYALRQAAEAAEKHDLTTFRKYVDTETLTARFVDDLLAVVREEAAASEVGTLAAGMVAIMRPQLVKAAQGALERGIETGNFEPERSQVGNPAREATSYWRPASEHHSGFRRIDYIRKEGSIAVAGLEMYDAELRTPFTVELKLRNTGDHWQVVEISNLRAVQKQLDEARKKK